MGNIKSMDDSLLQESTSVGSGEFENNYTLTSSCAASTFEAVNDAHVFSTALDTALRAFQIIYALLLVVIGSLLNSLIVFLVCKFRQLKTLSFGIALQICVTDLCLSLTYGFPLILNEIAGHWILGVELCVFVGFMLVFFIFLRDFLLLVFSIDKFCSVFVPFCYPKFSYKIVVILCVVSLCMCFVFSIISIPGLVDCYGLFEAATACSFIPTCNNICEAFGYSFILIGSLGSIVPIFLYLGLFIKGRRLHHNHLKILPRNENSISRKDWRASKTFALVFLAVFVVIKPPYVLYVTLLPTANVASYIVLKISFNIMFVCVITDPLLIMRNTDVKESLKEIFKKVRSSN